MDWLNRIVHTFIMTFGITEPSPSQRRAANLIIGGLLLMVFLGLLGSVMVAVRVMAR